MGKTRDSRIGQRVEVSNPKNKHYGKKGVASKLDRGNVWIKLDSGETICTRASCLFWPSDVDPYDDARF